MPMQGETIAAVRSRARGGGSAWTWVERRHRLETSEGLLYDLLRVVRWDEAELVVVREADGQVVARMPSPRVLSDRSSVYQDWEAGMSFLRKSSEADARRVFSATEEGIVFAEGLPALMEYLTAASYPDGAPRETSTVMLFCDGGVFKACLNDREAQRSLWASGPSFLDALEALEAMLSTGTGEWRQNAQWKGKGKGKK